jgi:hypothetical protein
MASELAAEGSELEEGEELVELGERGALAWVQVFDVFDDRASI